MKEYMRHDRADYDDFELMHICERCSRYAEKLTVRGLCEPCDTATEPVPENESED